mgnify:CR=1 FL=1
MTLKNFSIEPKTLFPILSDVSKIELPASQDNRGLLISAEDSLHIPFPIKRFFSITAVPKGLMRGGHAHRKLNQLLICLSGAVEVTCDDGQSRKKIMLCGPKIALHIPPTIWAEQNYEDEMDLYTNNTSNDDDIVSFLSFLGASLLLAILYKYIYI